MPRNRNRKKANKTLSPEEELKILEGLCRGESLTLSELRRQLEACPEETIRAHGKGDTLLHDVCFNGRVTLEIVAYLIDHYPEAIKHVSYYGWLPLHRACLNVHCPNEVILYLISCYPEGLQITWENSGLPLHCALRRFDESDYLSKAILVDVDLVRSLVEPYPEALMNRDNVCRDTPLLIACAKDASLELLQVLIDSDQVALSISGTHEDRLPLHVLFTRGSGPPPSSNVVKFLLENSPENALNEPDQYGDTPFHIACSKCKISVPIIEVFLNARQDLVEQVTRPFSPRSLPLHSLCMNEYIEDEREFLAIVKFLVEKYPMAVETVNNYGLLPLHYGASQRNFSEAAKFLISEYPQSVRIPAGNTGALPIHYASRGGNLVLVEFLYDLFPDSVSEKTFGGELPLHEASSNMTCDAAVVRFLIDKYPTGAGTPDENGNLPLHYLCRWHNQDLDIIRDTFATFPAAIHTKNKEGSLPLHSAFDVLLRSPKQEVVSFLIKQLPYGIKELDGEGRTLAHILCENSSASLADVKRTINLWPDALKMNSMAHGLPIHVACAYGLDLDVIKHLESRYRGSLDVCNALVGLPFDCAMDRRVFEYLLTKRYSSFAKRPPLHSVLLDDGLMDRATVAERLVRFFPGHAEDVDNRGSFPLHYAVSVVSELDFINELIELAPEAIDKQDATGSLPLHYALRHRASRDLVKRLLEVSPGSASTTDNQSNTPLHIACRYGAFLQVVSELVSAYPEGILALDWHGCVPLHVACRHGLSLDAIRYLVEADDATLHLLDERSELPLHKACRGGHLEIVKCLLENHMPSVRVRNGSGMLPVLILSQSSGKSRDIVEAPEYVETIWKLLLAHPESVMTALE